jgi:hypothetical protein
MGLPIASEYLAVSLLDRYRLEETNQVPSHIGDFGHAYWTTGGIGSVRLF